MERRNIVFGKNALSADKTFKIENSSAEEMIENRTFLNRLSSPAREKEVSTGKEKERKKEKKKKRKGGRCREKKSRCVEEGTGFYFFSMMSWMSPLPGLPPLGPPLPLPPRLPCE